MTEQTPQDAYAGWHDALMRRDQSGVLEYLDDDYNLIVLTPTFNRVTKAEWLATLPDYVISVWDVVSSEWDVLGDLAVHTHHINMEAVVMGGDRSGPVTMTDVWRRIDGRWRVWRRVSSPLAAGPMPRRDPETV
ncbi:MAG TPA: nuclear transport factor 2 family protein [Pseudolysinimonas sp.]